MARGRGGVTVSVEGLDELRKALQKLPDEVKTALRTALKESAEAVKTEVKKTAPVATGNLRDSVDIRYEDDGLTAQVGWWKKDDYYARWVEFGTKSRPAQPSLGPATELERLHIVERLRTHVRRAVQ